jgi:hypothetical protein
VTTAHIDGPKATTEVLTPLPVSALVIATWNLLEEASDLPHPHWLSVSDSQSLSLQFPPEDSSRKAITRWALRFGGVLTTKPHQAETGPQTWHRVEFTYYGIRVCAYAHIPAANTA